MTTLYIAGPMTGLPEFNYPAFHEAEKVLAAAGYLVLNPARNAPVGEPTWQAFMRMSLRQVIGAGGLALLDGWEGSRGAQLEVHVARELGLARLPVDAWLAAEVTP